MNARRSLLIAVGALLFAMPTLALAQPAPRLARIGVLVGSTVADNTPYIRSLREGLHDLGYVEGRNLVFEFRYAEGRFERLPELAADLVKLRVDVIVAIGDPVILAAKQATSTIPIVMAAVGDPVGRGFVESLARPGGNITGVSNLALPLTAKWLEALKQIVPALSQVAVLRNDANPTHALVWAEAQSAAATLGLKLQSVPIHRADDVEPAFAAVVREQSGAIVVLPDPLLAGFCERATRARDPQSSSGDVHVPRAGAGGLPRFVRAEHRRQLSQERDVRRQDPEGRESRRSSGRSADQVRSRRQHEDREGARGRDSAAAAAAR
jgi:putative ABC transport system substrate-binding protein